MECCVQCGRLWRKENLYPVEINQRGMFYGDSSTAGYIRWDLDVGRIGFSQGLTDLWGVFSLLQQLTVCIFLWLSDRQGAGCSDGVEFCFLLYDGKETQVNSCYWYLWCEALALGIIPVQRFLEQPLISSWEGLTEANHFDISIFLFPFWSSILLMIKHRLSQLRDSRAAESEII